MQHTFNTQQPFYAQCRFYLQSSFGFVAQIIFFIFCVCLAFIFWPLPVLKVELEGKTLLTRAMPLGHPYFTRIIHSVERTPVEDEYRIVHQKIWSWQERVQSHNAGLPFAKPENGSFLVLPPWFVVQGGRFSFDSINYRVGTQDLGHNELRFAAEDWLSLYEIYPKEKLVFKAGIENLQDYKFE